MSNILQFFKKSKRKGCIPLVETSPLILPSLQDHILDWWLSGPVNQIVVRVEPCSLCWGSFGNCLPLSRMPPWPRCTLLPSLPEQWRRIWLGRWSETVLSPSLLAESHLSSFVQEEMNTWIQAISSAISSDKHEVSASTQSTPASSRAQTLPTSVVTITSESSPGKREKDKEKDKEKRFSIFGKKKWTPFLHLLPFSYLFSEIPACKLRTNTLLSVPNVLQCGWFFFFLIYRAFLGGVGEIHLNTLSPSYKSLRCRGKTRFFLMKLYRLDLNI